MHFSYSANMKVIIISEAQKCLIIEFFEELWVSLILLEELREIHVLVNVNRIEVFFFFVIVDNLLLGYLG